MTPRFAYGEQVMCPDGRIGTIRGGVRGDNFNESDADAMLVVLVEGVERLFSEDDLAEHLS